MLRFFVLFKLMFRKKEREKLEIKSFVKQNRGKYAIVYVNI
jgi:hypothetical protein